MSRSILLLLPQLPHDPASGAARSMRTICEMLAAGGFRVSALGTTATEHARSADPVELLRAIGHAVEIDRRGAVGRGRPVLRLASRGIEYTLLHTGALGVGAWRDEHGRQFDRLYESALAETRPDIVFTFGGDASDFEHRRAARERGAVVVFGLRNHGYLDRRAFDHVDAVLTPSRFLSERYREAVGLASTPLPTPIDVDDVLAPDREPIFTTFVNPSRSKGVMLFARLAEELAKSRPDIPLLVVESRGSGGNLVKAGLDGGFDLRRHESVMISGGVARPADLFAPTRVILAPSVWEEPSGRVAAEALVNGIPPIVSSRGGLPETCAGAGFVVDLPEDLTVETAEPVGADGVAEWCALIASLADDEERYAACSRRAREAGRQYLPDVLAPRYVEFFENVERAAEPVVGRGAGSSRASSPPLTAPPPPAEDRR